MRNQNPLFISSPGHDKWWSTPLCDCATLPFSLHFAVLLPHSTILTTLCCVAAPLCHSQCTLLCCCATLPFSLHFAVLLGHSAIITTLPCVTAPLCNSYFTALCYHAALLALCLVFPWHSSVLTALRTSCFELMLPFWMEPLHSYCTILLLTKQLFFLTTLRVVTTLLFPQYCNTWTDCNCAFSITFSKQLYSVGSTFSLKGQWNGKTYH